MNRFVFCCVVVSSIVFVMAGCTDFKQPARNIHYYFPEYPAPSPVVDTSLAPLLQIRRFRTAKELDSKQMIYSDGPFRRNAYVYHRWWEIPGDMVTSLLSRDLERSGLFRAVAGWNDTVQPTHVLDGMVEGFHETVSENGPMAVLSVSVLFLDNRQQDMTKAILFNKQYEKTIPMPRRGPRHLAQSLSDAMASISRQLSNDIRTTLKPNS